MFIRNDFKARYKNMFIMIRLKIIHQCADESTFIKPGSHLCAGRYMLTEISEASDTTDS